MLSRPALELVMTFGGALFVVVGLHFRRHPEWYAPMPFRGTPGFPSLYGGAVAAIMGMLMLLADLLR